MSMQASFLLTNHWANGGFLISGCQFCQLYVRGPRHLTAYENEVLFLATWTLQQRSPLHSNLVGLLGACSQLYAIFHKYCTRPRAHSHDWVETLNLSITWSLLTGGGKNLSPPIPLFYLVMALTQPLRGGSLNPTLYAASQAPRDHEDVRMRNDWAGIHTGGDFS